MYSNVARKIIPVIFVLIVSFQLGCMGGKQYVPEKRWHYPKELADAHRAVEDARAGGKDKECPDEFKAVEKMKEDAFDIYHACRDEEAIAIANNAIAKVRTLCSGKTAPSPSTKPLEPAPKPSVDEPKALKKDKEKPEKIIDRLTITVYFDFDKSDIRRSEDVELKKAVEFVRKYAGYKIRIEGHTCNIGTEKYNQGLSERRADAVKRYLIGKGIVDGAKITIKGYGESKPIVSNKTKAGRVKNRRAEILIISE